MNCEFWFSLPQQLERVPILTINSSPEFETDPERLKEMLSEVCLLLYLNFNVWI